MTAKMGVRSVLLSQHYPPPSLHDMQRNGYILFSPERLGIVRVTHACLTKKPPENALRYCILIIFYVFFWLLHLFSLFTILCI